MDLEDITRSEERERRMWYHSYVEFKKKNKFMDTKGEKEWYKLGVPN